MNTYINPPELGVNPWGGEEGVNQSRIPQDSWILHSPLFSRIFIRSLNAQRESRENCCEQFTGEVESLPLKELVYLLERFESI